MSRSQSRLSGAARTIVEGLNKDQEDELKEAFILFDGDDSGTMGSRELQVVMNAIGRNMELADIEANI